MSGITTISIAAPTQPDTVPTAPGGVTPGLPPTAEGNVAQPAVIVSLTGAASSGQQPLPEANPNEVNRTLASLGGVNGFAWAYEHFDWDALAKRCGTEWADEQKNIKLRGMGVFASNAETNLASNPAIPVHRVANPNATADEPLKTTFTVSDFSFTNNGSVYSITHGENGLMNGTKDGQWWATWQITTLTADQSGAAIALKTLTPLTAQTTSTAQETPAIDITA